MTTIEELYRADYSPLSGPHGPDGRWLPARPYGGFAPFGPWGRLKDAWAVFRGRAEAVQWPDQREDVA